MEAEAGDHGAAPAHGGEMEAPLGGVPSHRGAPSPHPVLIHLGLSENSVPLHPMVNDHYPY